MTADYFSRHRRTEGRVCSDCPNIICNRNVSGRCQSCCRKAIANDPILKERRRQGLAKKMATDPIYRAQLRSRMRQVGLNAGRDPEIQRMRRERGPEVYRRNLDNDEVRAKILATRPSVAAQITEQRLGWCPPEYRAEYKALIRNRRIPSARAKEIILAKIKADKERAEAALSPFERQLRALQNGGKLVANTNRPAPGNQVITDPTLRRAG